MMKYGRSVSGVSILAGLFSVLTIFPAASQDVGIDPGAASPLDAGAGDAANVWRYTLGAGVAAVPDYEGSDDYEPRPLIIGRIQKGHQFGEVIGAKLRTNLVPHPSFRLGPVLNYRPKRDDVENSAVDNLDDVDAAFELGLQAGYEHQLGAAGAIGVGFEVLQDVADGHDGWLLTPQISYRRLIAQRWKFRMAASSTYASEDYMDSYFSVSPGESARSGLSTFSASDGFKDVGVAGSLSYGLTQNWDVGGVWMFKRLLNDAEDSPVTEVGDENQFALGLFVSYSWSSQ